MCVCVCVCVCTIIMDEIIYNIYVMDEIIYNIYEGRFQNLQLTVYFESSCFFLTIAVYCVTPFQQFCYRLLPW